MGRVMEWEDVVDDFPLSLDLSDGGDWASIMPEEWPEEISKAKATIPDRRPARRVKKSFPAHIPSAAEPAPEMPPFRHRPSILDCTDPNIIRQVHELVALRTRVLKLKADGAPPEGVREIERLIDGMEGDILDQWELWRQDSLPPRPGVGRQDLGGVSLEEGVK